MKPILVCVAIVASLVGLMACREDIAPIVSGEVSFRGYDGANYERALTQNQLSQLTDWLKEHRSGWGMQLVTDPLPSTVCTMRHSDGQTSALAFYSVQGWAKTVKLCGSGHTSCAMQSFSDKDVYALHQLLGIEQS